MNGELFGYLAHSKYGLNTKTINNNEDFYTGGGAGDAYKINTDQSTTGNITGIYDMSGGLYEFTASYNKAYSKTEELFGGEGGNESFYKPLTGVHFVHGIYPNSNRYVTAYENNSSTNSVTNIAQFKAGRNVSITGDGILEAWKGGTASWNASAARFTDIDNPFYSRGRILWSI